ncbi:hypothetical protein EJB05_02635, partial [Eragrostis curvula]
LERQRRQMEPRSSDHDNKRSDPDKTPEEGDDGGDAKRRPEGDHAHNGAMKMEMDEEEEEDMSLYKPFGMYCYNWISMYGHCGKFDDPTETAELLPMRNTDGPILPICAVLIDTMEIFYVKVSQTSGRLQWPLDVYGDVAVRDSLDHKRNYLFRRCRERCQTLTSPQAYLKYFRSEGIGYRVFLHLKIVASLLVHDHNEEFVVEIAESLKSRCHADQFEKVSHIYLPVHYVINLLHEQIDILDSNCNSQGKENKESRLHEDSLLELTGRAVLLLDRPAFEIDLKVKAKEESEDTVLCCDFFVYDNISYKGDESYATTEVVPSEHSQIEVKYAHLVCSLEATITARIISGSGNFWARLTAGTASIGEDVVLLDTRGLEVPVAKDGEVFLKRRVVVVEEHGKLILGIKAAQLGDGPESSTVLEKKMTYRARSALRSEGYFVIGSTRLHMMIAWSVLP